MESGEFTGLPRYVITFLYQMGHYPEYLRWNVTEASHKITLTLTWNFSCSAAAAANAKRQTPFLLKTGLWDRLQRTLRRPDGSVPPEISAFLQRTAVERSAEAAAAAASAGDHTAGRSAYTAASSSSSKPRKLSDALKEFRSRRRMRASLSLPDRIMDPPQGSVAAVSSPGDESRTPSERRTAISYPTTPVRSPNVNGGCPSAAAANALRPGGKTVSWPRLGDLLYVAADATVRATRPFSVSAKVRDHPPNEAAKAKPMIFVQRASPDVALSFSSRTDRGEQGGLLSGGPCSRDEGSSSRQRHSSLGQAAATANPALNQTVLKCLDSCDKILFRHSTTIT